MVAAVLACGYLKGVFMLSISNYYEQLVIDRLWKISENSAEPLSQAFLEDVACLALNKLPTCYVRHLVDKGADLTERRYQEMMDVVDAAIDQAIKQVHSHPHDIREK